MPFTIYTSSYKKNHTLFAIVYSPYLFILSVFYLLLPQIPIHIFQKHLHQFSFLEEASAFFASSRRKHPRGMISAKPENNISGFENRGRQDYRKNFILLPDAWYQPARLLLLVPNSASLPVCFYRIPDHQQIFINGHLQFTGSPLYSVLLAFHNFLSIS